MLEGIQPLLVTRTPIPLILVAHLQVQPHGQRQTPGE